MCGQDDTVRFRGVRFRLTGSTIMMLASIFVYQIENFNPPPIPLVLKFPRRYTIIHWHMLLVEAGVRIGVGDYM